MEKCFKYTTYLQGPKDNFCKTQIDDASDSSCAIVILALALDLEDLFGYFYIRHSVYAIRGSRFDQSEEPEGGGM